jgi:putative flippase GtrA
MEEDQSTGRYLLLVQFLRYAVLGVLTNLLGYLVYLTITHFGGTPKATMSVMYCVGAFISFWGNRQWAFGHKGGVLGSGFRFMMLQVLGYLLNLAILVVGLDRMGYPHQMVQGLAIVIVACFLFLGLKLAVFKHTPVSGETGS